MRRVAALLVALAMTLQALNSTPPDFLSDHGRKIEPRHLSA